MDGQWAERSHVSERWTTSMINLLDHCEVLTLPHRMGKFQNTPSKGNTLKSCGEKKHTNYKGIKIRWKLDFSPATLGTRKQDQKCQNSGSSNLDLEF